MRILHLISLLSLILLFNSCSSSQKRIVIGFSQCNTDDAWRVQMIQEMQLETSFYDNIELVIKDAHSSSSTQADQIKELLAQNVDILIVSPYETQPLTKIVEDIYDSGIPVIVLDRKVNTLKYNSYIGGSNYSIGFGAGQYALKSLSNSSKILEVCGLPSSSPASERHKGFIDGLSTVLNNFTVDSINGDWLNDNLLRDKFLKKKGSNYDFIFVHNDIMALGVSTIYSEIGTDSRKPIIIGVDGLAGSGNGVEGILNDKINGTFLYPTGGVAAIKTALLILENKSYPKEQMLGTSFIDKDNAPGIVMQHQRESGYLEKIKLSREKLDSLSQLYTNRLTMIYLLTFLLILIAISLYIIYKGFKKYKNQSEELSLLNQQYLIQTATLAEANEKIEESTNNKLLFFNNVIHDIRTLLTLMRIPLDQLLDIKLEPTVMKEIAVVNNGNQRLYILINQLLDFHKLEQKKTKLSVSYSGICKIVSRVCETFKYQAHNREMKFEVNLPKEDVFLFFDTDKIGKVVFNLLSNSFKFTNDKGLISVSVEDFPEMIKIIIADNGSGIEIPEDAQIFDRFYQSYNFKNIGSGLGLNIAKEFIELHGGKIYFESTLYVGTIFHIELWKQKEKLPGEYFIISDESCEDFGDVQIIEESKSISFVQNENSEEKSHTLLIVDDDYDLRNYLGDFFRKKYKVFLASSGEQAIDYLNKKEIDMVISDVMMPKISGIELCTYIKTSSELSSIPCILLTALGNEEDQIKGLTAGAEDYISKPFSITSLNTKISNILKTSDALRESFSKSFILPDEFINSEVATKAEVPFLTKFMQYLHVNYSDSELGIEKISTDFNLSRIQLYRKVKSLSGYSPVEVLNDYRLKVAGNLLKNGNLNVSEICYMSGFSSPAYFSKCFKNHYGMTPNDYRKQ